jgi:hypothetical protein
MRLAEEQCEQLRQVRKVARQQHVAWFMSQAIAHPPWRIVGLQIAGGREVRQRIARAPE